MFLWLKNDINQLSARMDKLQDEVAALRESVAWIRGRMGFTEPQAQAPVDD